MNLFGDSLKEKLKTANVAIRKPTSFYKGDLFFQIATVNGLLVLKVVDKTGQVVSDYLTECYSPDIRNVLHFYRYSKAKNAEMVYLADSPSLIRLVTLCENIVNERMEHIIVEEITLEIFLHVTRQSLDSYTTSFTAANNTTYVERFQMLSEEYMMAGNKIYPVTPIGSRYALLHEFIQSIPMAMVEQFLSVFYSYFENVRLTFEMRQYQIIYKNTTKKTQTTIVLNELDEDKTLSLRVLQALPNFDLDIMADIKLLYAAQLDKRGVLILDKVGYQKSSGDINKIHQMMKPFCKKTWEWRALMVSDDSFSLPKHIATKFMAQCLSQLSIIYRIVGTKKLKDYVFKPIKPQIRMIVSYGVNYFYGKPMVQIGNVEYNLVEFLKKYQAKEYIELANQEKGLIDKGFLRKLKRICEESDKKTGEIKMSFFDMPEIEKLLGQKLEGDELSYVRSFYEGMAKLSMQPQPKPKVNAILRNYQQEGVKWLYYLYKHNRNGCLADDMGLGKTLQTISLMTLVQSDSTKPSLIIMPNSLLFNWEYELKRFAPQLNYCVYYGKERDLEKALKTSLILTTYTIVRNEIKTLSQWPFHYIILDESQAIKNFDAQTSKAMRLLDGSHRLALSGTPIENNLTELYSLFSFLEPTMFGDIKQFNERFLSPIMSGNKQVTSELRARVYPFIMRRMKEEVLNDLPDLTENVIYVEMGEEQKKLYEIKRKIALGLIGDSKMQVTFFETLSELRQIASIPEVYTSGKIMSPKAEMLTNHILQTAAAGKKMVVFFHYLGGIETMRKRLEDAHIDYDIITGKTRNRKAVIERFNMEKECQVLMMTLKTGGVGLNLTVADTVFIYEPWWNKAAELQGIDRLHRIGQTRKVFSYSLIAKDSIEERILELQRKKTDLCNDIIRSDKIDGKLLSGDDMRFLCR